MLPRTPTSTLFPYTTLFRSQLDLGRRARLDDGHAASQLGQPLLQLLAVVVGVGVLDLRADLVDPARDLLRVAGAVHDRGLRSEEHTSELQSRGHLVCRLLLE